MFAADDEQSDWFGGDGARGWWEDDDEERSSPIRDKSAVQENDPAFQALLEGSFKHMSESSKRAFADRVRWLKSGMVSHVQKKSSYFLHVLWTAVGLVYNFIWLFQGERTIRAGRRRLRDTRAGFSVLTSANEKLSRFLQDPTQLELR